MGFIISSRVTANAGSTFRKTWLDFLELSFSHSDSESATVSSTSNLFFDSKDFFWLKFLGWVL